MLSPRYFKMPRTGSSVDGEAVDVTLNPSNDRSSGGAIEARAGTPVHSEMACIIVVQSLKVVRV